MEAQDTFEMLKRVYVKAFMLAFANFDKPFFLEMDASKLELGAVFSQKQADDWHYLVAYASQSLTTHEQSYHWMKQEFLALKWAIVKQVQEYILWKPFIVRTDNNPLTYIITTPILDATWHW